MKEVRMPELEMVESQISTIHLTIREMARQLTDLAAKHQHLHELVLDTNIRIDELERT